MSGRGAARRGNKYAGPCCMCGVEVAAGAGVLLGSRGAGWRVAHDPASWHGSPVSGFYVGGCPGEAAALNVKGGWGPDWARVIPEAVEVEAVPPARASVRSMSGAARAHYGRCEDAPCCGCCD